MGMNGCCPLEPEYIGVNYIDVAGVNVLPG